MASQVETSTGNPSNETHKTIPTITTDSFDDGSGSPMKGGPITYVTYTSEEQLPGIIKLIEKDLSEPYSVYTYRYFINGWPELCFIAMHEGKSIGCIVSKLDMHGRSLRGYIAMLAVEKEYRKKGIGRQDPHRL
jgi:peptide alpha-N-acetyltransferase